MTIKSFAILFLALLAILLSNITFTFELRIPTYGLYCEDSEIIKNSKVKFDLTETELLSQWNDIMQYEYQVAANKEEVEFAIPFLASACTLPQIAVTVNGQAVEGSVWFGDEAYWAENEFDIENTYSPVLDESITGTLYTVIPDNDTITIALTCSETKSFIYHTSMDLSSSISADGCHTWTFRDALSEPCYYFFVFGDEEGYSFDSSCECQTETVTCKEFVDRQYKELEDYYDYYGGVPKSLFYSAVNKVLQSNSYIQYDELFFNSVDLMRLNAYKFSIPIETDAVIRYELPISVQRNYATSYTIEININFKYLLYIQLYVIIILLTVIGV